MFEAVITLCLMSDPAICRDQLIPGARAETVEACEAALPAPIVPEGFAAGEPRCQPPGHVAEVKEADFGVFVHRGIISDAEPENYGDVSNTGFVIGREAVAVIDSGGSRKAGEELYRAVRAQTDLPVKYLILTHMHPDHVLGASVFAEAGAEVIGHAGLARALADRAGAYIENFGGRIGAPGFIGTEVTLPDIDVEDSMILDLGGRFLRLKAWQSAHTNVDLTVGDDQSGIMFTGDLVFSEHTPSLDGSVLGWQEVLQGMKRLTYSRIMPGHGGPLLAWPESCAPLSRYLEVLTEETRAAIKRGDSLSEAVATVAQGEAGNWELFELFNPRNVTVAYTELEWE